MKATTKTRLAAIAALLVVVALLGAVKAMQIGAMIEAGESFVMPPESVTAAEAKATQWQSARRAVGSVVAIRAVTLGSELPGTVLKIGFDSGTTVKKGALLVRLDTSTEEAQLESALAEQALARLDLDRAVQLRRGGSNSPADLDSARARARQADAAVAALKATIAKKVIRAPFEGRIAIRKVELGQVVTPGTPIASLQSIDPIYAEFSLPQQALADVQAGQRALLHTDTFPGETWDGKVNTINSEVDVDTRNVRFRAVFANQDGRLRPGMFANVEVLGDERAPVISVPATAVLYAPYGDSVYVIEEEKHEKTGQPVTVARQKFVRLGERRGDFVAVVSGLAAGEKVVDSGAFKLRNGTEVVVGDKLAPRAEISPTPADG